MTDTRRNPSAWGTRWAIAILAMLAFAAGSYMALYQWGFLSSAWDPFFGDQTERVLDSDVSHRLYSWIGIPDAALGALAYLGDAIFSLAGSARRWQYRPWLVLLFGFFVIPVGIVGAILVALQGTVVGSWCALCLFTAVISLVLIALAYPEVSATIGYLRRVYNGTGDRKTLMDTFWGRRPAEAEKFAGEIPGVSSRSKRRRGAA